MPSRAVVIGVDHYPKLDPQLQLTASTKDAIGFAEWLIRDQDFSPNEVQLGLSFQAGLEQPVPAGVTIFDPTSDDVDEQLSLLLTAGKLDRLLFFFAGHGAAAANVQFADMDAICCANYSATLTTNALSLQSIAKVLKGVEADERFLIVDACRDPAIPEAKRIGEAAASPVPSRYKPGLYVLKATALGEQASAMKLKGGVMTTALLDALAHRRGPAKQWDATNDDYVVRWQRLKAAVAERVAASTPGQQPFSNDDAPSGSDPEITRFPQTTVQPVTLAVIVVPAPMPDMKLTVLREGGPLVTQTFPIPGTIPLPQSNYSISVQGGGAVQPSFLSAFPVFDGDQPPALTITIAAAPLAAPPLIPAAFEVERRGLGVAGDETVAEAFPATRNAGTLAVSVGGAPVAANDPLISVSVRSTTGEAVDWDPATPTETVLEGTYNVRVVSASGTARDEQVYVEAGGEASVDVFPAFEPEPALSTALESMGQMPGPSPLPSELLGPLSDLTFAALGGLSVAQAVLHREHANARALGLGERWSRSDATGVHLLVADSTATPVREERLRVWRMHESAPGAVDRTKRPKSDVNYWEAGVAVRPDGYWVELADADRKQRAGFKVATAVMPNCVALLIVAREPGASVKGEMGEGASKGRNALFQLAIDRAAPVKQVLGGIVYGEALQRGRLEGRSLREDAAMRTLIAGDWYEPFSAALACFANYAAGEAFDAEFRSLVEKIEARSPALPDLAVARGLRAELDDDADAAAAHYLGALERFDMPVCSAAATYLRDAAQRMKLHGPGRRYLDEKARQMVTHPLWTLRREDDVKRAGKPNISVRP